MVTPERHVAMVDRLVKETVPIKRLWSVGARLTVCAGAGAAILAVFVTIFPRPDLSSKLHEPWFALGLAALVTITLYTASLALRCAVPGREPSPTESVLAFVLIAGASFVTCMPGAEGAPAANVDPGWMCSLRTLGIAALPWVLLLLAIRRGAPVTGWRAGAFGAAAALLLATLSLRTACPQDGSLHWLAWHFGPVAVGTALSATLGAAWLRVWHRPN